MAHFRRKVGAALLLNTSISVVEAVASVPAHSLSLLTDSFHNCSDELALVCLYLAFFLPGYIGRHSQRLANALNSIGLVALSGVMIWQGISRLIHPAPVQALTPILAGLGAAAANYGVAHLLRVPARHNAAVRLAYLHNRGDVFVSLAPVIAGFSVALTGRPQGDVMVALTVAVWLIVSTVRELHASMNDLLWPEDMACGHPLTAE